MTHVCSTLHHYIDAGGQGHWSGAAFVGHRPCAPAAGSIGLGQRPGASDQWSTGRLHQPLHTTAFIYRSDRHDRHFIHICVQCTLLGASLSKHRRCTTFAVSLSHRLHNISALQSPSACINIALVSTHRAVVLCVYYLSICVHKL